MRRTIATLALVLFGCPPDLTEFEVVTAIGPGTDAGPRTTAEPDFGTPCTDPHVAVTVQERSSTETGQIRRFQLPSLAPCRESDLARAHPALGSEVHAITGLPDGDEVVGVEGALIRLDGEGFPVWRLGVDRSGGFTPLELFPIEHAGASRVVAAYWGTSSSADGLLLVDLAGEIVHEWTEGTFGANSFAPDPSTPGSLLVSRYGDLHAVPVDASSPRLADGIEVLPRSDTAGTLITIDTAPSGQVVIAYAQGLVMWTPSTGETTTPVVCPAPCGDFHAATWDPTDPAAALAICTDATMGSTRHLVRVRTDGTCTIAFDGTFLASGLLTEVAIIP